MALGLPPAGAGALRVPALRRVAGSVGLLPRARLDAWDAFLLVACNASFAQFNDELAVPHKRAQRLRDITQAQTCL